jgi:hypothetical protein
VPQALGLDSEDIVEVRVVATWDDLGRLRLPPQLLDYPNRLFSLVPSLLNQLLQLGELIACERDQVTSFLSPIGDGSAFVRQIEKKGWKNVVHTHSVQPINSQAWKKTSAAFIVRLLG